MAANLEQFLLFTTGLFFKFFFNKYTISEARSMYMYRGVQK
jgi:hypothetical protein